MAASLSRLFQPKSIAILGGFWAENVIEQCERIGFDGEIWPVHPTRTEMFGRPCYRDLDALPTAPDVAYLAVNRTLTVSIVAQLQQMGAGGVVCFASGFEESDHEGGGGAALQRQLVDAAGDMPLLGPNCYGYINLLAGVALWPDQHGARSTDSGVAIIGQSSNIAINLTMQSRGLPISHVITVGNQAQLNAFELASWLLDDPRVTAVGLHIEGFKDIAALAALAAKSRHVAKPVVVIKVGESSLAQAATITHSASVAGSGDGATALWKRLGMAQVNSFPQFVDTLTFFHVLGVPASTTLGSASCSGGEAALIADIAARHEIALPEFSSTAAARLKDQLGPLVTVANPLDFHTYIWTKWDLMTRMYETMLAEQFGLAVLITDLPRVDRCDPEDWARSVGAWIDAVRATDAAAAVAATLPENMPEWMADRLIEEGIVPFCGLEEMCAALAAATDVRNGWCHPQVPILPAPATPLPITAAQNKPLREHDAKQRLQAAGLTVPRGQIVATAAELTEAIAALGYPLAIKALGLAHKTELNAIRLNITDQAMAEQAARALWSLSPNLLIEQMVQSPVCELMIGVIRDYPNGFVLTLSAGGTLAELMTTRACLLVPASRTAIEDALKTLPVAKLITGYRGQPGGEISTVVDAVAAVQNFVTAQADTLLELDINPLIVTANAAIGADALVLLQANEEKS